MHEVTVSGIIKEGGKNHVGFFMGNFVPDVTPVCIFSGASTQLMSYAALPFKNCNVLFFKKKTFSRDHIPWIVYAQQSLRYHDYIPSSYSLTLRCLFFFLKREPNPCLINEANDQIAMQDLRSNGDLDKQFGLIAYYNCFPPPTRKKEGNFLVKFLPSFINHSKVCAMSVQCRKQIVKGWGICERNMVRAARILLVQNCPIWLNVF